MNEDFKSGAPPSGLVERKNKPDDHAGSATLGDLNEFLIHRQLLAMEAKRIQDLLREAEIELKSKQDHLIDIRDRVLASLRGHLVTSMNCSKSKFQQSEAEESAKNGGALCSPSK